MTNATIEVYNGSYDTVPETDPAWSETVEIANEWWGNSYPTQVAHEADTVLFAEEIEFHSGSIELFLDTPIDAMLCVHTCDRYHDPNDWGKPIEQGLNFKPVSGRPFGCEIWGRVLMWVANDE